MKTMLLTIGTFDLPHIGHAIFLRKCESLADLVTVGVNSDSFVTRYKGQPPVLSEYERVELIESLGYRVMLNDGPGRALVDAVGPDVIAIGTDWARRDYYAQIDTPLEVFEERGISLVYIPYTFGISSTLIKQKLGNR